MDIGRFLFITIHSTPICSSYAELKETNPGLGIVWKNYCGYIYNDHSGQLGDDVCEVGWMDKASFVPEFCRIDLITLGYKKDGELIVKELRGSEPSIFRDLNDILTKVQRNDWIVCGWNIKNYDIPLLNKRYFINKIKPHSIIPKSDTKPWEMKTIFDLKEFWNGTASRGINTIDALYYSFCSDADVKLFENKDELINASNRITKMFNIILELSNIEE
jgi:hypothetical protein